MPGLNWFSAVFDFFSQLRPLVTRVHKAVSHIIKSMLQVASSSHFCLMAYVITHPVEQICQLERCVTLLYVRTTYVPYVNLIKLFINGVSIKIVAVLALA
jgi:hypothetical protein